MKGNYSHQAANNNQEINFKKKYLVSLGVFVSWWLKKDS